MAKTTKKTETPKTYEAAMPNGRKVRCTVPESENIDSPLMAAMMDSFSPEAVAAMAAYLQAASTKQREVNRELHWFADELIKLVGQNEFPSMLKGLGL